jgi:hypothetical protein
MGNFWGLDSRGKDGRKMPLTRRLGDGAVIGVAAWLN